MDWDNVDSVLGKVKKNSTAFLCASDRLKDHEEIVFLAVKQDGYASLYASTRL